MPPSSESMEEGEQRTTMDRDGQRAVIQSFALIEGKTAMDAYNHLCQALGPGAMTKVGVMKLFKEFRDGRTDYKDQRGEHMKDKAMTGEARTVRNEENISKIRDLIAYAADWGQVRVVCYC